MEKITIEFTQEELVALISILQEARDLKCSQTNQFHFTSEQRWEEAYREEDDFCCSCTGFEMKLEEFKE